MIFDPSTRVGPAQRSVLSWLTPSTTLTIQTGTIAMANTVLTNTATITAVDVNQAELIYNWGGQDNPAQASDIAYVLLTDSTTVTATRITPGANTLTVGFTVRTRPAGFFRSVQRGTVTILSGAASGTATITGVNTSKAVVTILGMFGESAPARVVLTNSTTITASIDNGNAVNDIVMAYQVLEEW